MKILLAIDGSEDAAAALEFLLRFPFPGGSTVTLLTVIDAHLFVDTQTVELSAEQQQVLHGIRNTVREEAEQYLAEAARRLGAGGWEATTLLRQGYIAAEIVQAAEELQADLVVVGSHGEAPVRDFLLGSVSSMVLEHAPCSVLIIRQAPAGQPLPGTAAAPWRVLLAYNASAQADKALALCSALPFGAQDEIEVVTALALITGYRQDIHQQMSPIWQQKKLAARAALEAAVARLSGSGARVTSQLREGGSSAREIIEAAAAAGSHLIVLGSKDKSPLQRLLVGSLTSQVARHAACSVWAVRGG